MLTDVQNQSDKRNIPIDRVGVKDVSYPIDVMDKHNQKQHTVANINMYVGLPENFRGTHMSRFIEILNHYRGMITMKNIPEILQTMCEKLSSNSSHITIEFPYFIEKEAPISKIRSLSKYMCRFQGSYEHGKDDFVLGVKAPVSSLCPCSKEISEFGAHNQRSYVEVNVRFSEFVWIEDIIDIIESCASSEVYSLLKRNDEKYLTEKAYSNPKFVEDIVRDVAVLFDQHPHITWYTIESENHESIHNHNAYAFIKKSRGEQNG